MEAVNISAPTQLEAMSARAMRDLASTPMEETALVSIHLYLTHFYINNYDTIALASAWIQIMSLIHVNNTECGMSNLG